MPSIPATSPVLHAKHDHARSQGRSFGAKLKTHGSDCPYDFADTALRQAWFAGFSKGRTVLHMTLMAGD